MNASKMSTNKQTRVNIRVMRILNREIKDPDKLERILKEIEEVIEKEEGATEADQSQTVTP